MPEKFLGKVNAIGNQLAQYPWRGKSLFDQSLLTTLPERGHGVVEMRCLGDPRLKSGTRFPTSCIGMPGTDFHPGLHQHTDGIERSRKLRSKRHPADHGHLLEQSGGLFQRGISEHCGTMGTTALGREPRTLQMDSGKP